MRRNQQGQREQFSVGEIEAITLRRKQLVVKRGWMGGEDGHSKTGHLSGAGY